MVRSTLSAQGLLGVAVAATEVTVDLLDSTWKISNGNRGEFIRRRVLGGQELGSVGERQETVGETGRYPHLFLVLRAQGLADPLSEGFRPFPEVDRDIEAFALHYPHQLALCLRRQLIVQPAQDILN